MIDTFVRSGLAYVYTKIVLNGQQKWIDDNLKFLQDLHRKN